MTTYKCSKCDFIRSVKGYVTQHINRTVNCNGATLLECIVPVCCEVCDKKFDNNNLLNIHRKSCFEKKAIIKAEYKDADDFNKRIDKMSAVMKTLIEQNEEFKNELNKITKRLDKTEKSIKDGFEELSHNDSNCEYDENKGPFIISHDQVCKFFGWDEDDIKCYMKFKVLANERVEDAVMSENSIKVQGKMYKFDPKEKKKGDGSVGELQIYEPEQCDKTAKYFNSSKSISCCEEHKYYYT